MRNHVSAAPSRSRRLRDNTTREREHEHVEMKAALSFSDQENAVKLIEAAVEKLRAAVDLVGDTAGTASHSYRALGVTVAFLERVQNIPVLPDEGRE